MPIDFRKYPLPGRIRHHTLPYLYLPASELKIDMDYYPPLYDKIDWKEIFFNGKQPEALDIGCGKGAFLFEYSLQNTEKNILGMELRIAPVKWINTVIKGEDLKNCAAFWYSVANGIPFIADCSIDSIFYLFPDPWPKKRHIKRRAFNSLLLKEIFRVLKNDGELYLATDVPEVDEYHRAILKENGNFILNDITSDKGWNLPRTNKEKFCIKENIPYYRIICQKK